MSAFSWLVFWKRKKKSAWNQYGRGFGRVFTCCCFERKPCHSTCLVYGTCWEVSYLIFLFFSPSVKKLVYLMCIIWIVHWLSYPKRLIFNSILLLLLHPTASKTVMSVSLMMISRCRGSRGFYFQVPKLRLTRPVFSGYFMFSSTVHGYSRSLN